MDETATKEAIENSGNHDELIQKKMKEIESEVKSFSLFGFSFHFFAIFAGSFFSDIYILWASWWKV